MTDEWECYSHCGVSKNLFNKDDNADSVDLIVRFSSGKTIAANHNGKLIIQNMKKDSTKKDDSHADTENTDSDNDSNSDDALHLKSDISLEKFNEAIDHHLTECSRRTAVDELGFVKPLKARGSDINLKKLDNEKNQFRTQSVQCGSSGLMSIDTDDNLHELIWKRGYHITY